jgi:hypothetical protein
MKMRMTLITMAAISALAIGAPAAAQYPSSQNAHRGHMNSNGNLAARIDELQLRLNAGVRSGSISRREAIPLREQIRQLTRIERRYSMNGISGRERADLQQRMRNLRRQMRVADGGANGRYDRYDRDYAYGERDRYDHVDVNRDGRDDRDSRWDDEGRDNGYQQPVQRGGLAGVVDGLLGTGGLQVGQRASSDLYGVPTEYRGQYRDGDGAYYRSDGRQIYQIDARTDTVIRVYAMNR